MSIQKWTETEQFRHVVKYVKYQPQDEYPTLLFRGTVKLHGSNLAVTRDQGEFFFQSRKQFIRPGKEDVYGFAGWFDEQMKDETFEAELNKAFDLICNDPDDIATLYGEWVGPGIQSNVAVNGLAEKSWFIFGARVNGEYVENNSMLNVPSCDRIYNILEFPTFFQGIDFNSDDFEEVLDHLQRLTLAVEEQCPVGDKLGLKGIGEGIVWTCVEHPTNSSLFFKTKGEKHSGKPKTDKKVATIAPEVMKKIEDVVDYVVTEGRLQQGLENVPEVEMAHVGTYLKWISQDILKEETDTLEANELTWKEVSKYVMSRAREFFINKVNSNF